MAARPRPAAKTKAKVSEAEMLVLLRARHSQKSGNGEAYVFATHVRSAAGHDARRTIDGIAMSLWESRGLELIGYEVKVSRSDWLAEYKNPAKAEEFAPKLDRFYLVVSDPDIVAPGELPPTWGLLVKRGNRLVVSVEAPLLRATEARGRAPLPPGFDRSFLAALLRAAARVGSEPAEIAEARAEATALAQRAAEKDIRAAERRREQLQEKVDRFEEVSGLDISSFSFNRTPDQMARAVRAVLDGETRVENVRRRLERSAHEAKRIYETAHSLADEYRRLEADPEQKLHRTAVSVDALEEGYDGAFLRCTPGGVGLPEGSVLIPVEDLPQPLQADVAAGKVFFAQVNLSARRASDICLCDIEPEWADTSGPLLGETSS